MPPAYVAFGRQREGYRPLDFTLEGGCVCTLSLGGFGRWDVFVGQGAHLPL